VLIGLAAGDRIGGPIRFALRLAESLLDHGGFNPSDVLERYLRWWREGAFDTGPVSERALELIAKGMPVSEATAQVHREMGGKTVGCNPAHRSPPLAMLASLADEDLAVCAHAEARLTHYDPLAGHVSAEVTRLCRSLIRGGGWGDAVRHGSFTDDRGPGSNGGYAPDVLRAALYFVGASADFVEALERSLVFAGPANYRPVLVGALGGARWRPRPSWKRPRPTPKYSPGSGRSQRA
jgi:ADP-ribosylglycohydrolase